MAAALPLLLLLHGLAALEPRPAALLLFGLGVAEWPLGSYWLVAVGELFGRPPTWQEMLVIYPETQLLRWGVALLLLMLTLMQAPLWLLALGCLLGLAAAGTLLGALTRRIYRVDRLRGWVGAFVPLLYQGFLYALLLYFLR